MFMRGVLTVAMVIVNILMVLYFLFYLFSKQFFFIRSPKPLPLVENIT